MIWIVVIALALAAFGIAVLAFRLPGATWSSLLAALALGLTGYALQASPDLPGSPRSAQADRTSDEWQVVESRRALIGQDLRSTSNLLITADAFARRGRFEQSAALLSAMVKEDPRDFEVWVALGNALTEQADGMFTQASLYAFAQAERLQPRNPAPDYFLGLSLIRQGRLMEARQVWNDALAKTAPDDEARPFLADRAGRLDAMLTQMNALPPAPGQAVQ